EARAVLTSPEVRTVSRDHECFQTSDLRGLVWIDSQTDANGLEAAWREPDSDGKVPALIQYTSGSTSEPSGGAISHANFLHNSHSFYQAFGNSSGSGGLSWLPPCHDMGLVGGVLQPIFGGFPCVLMPAATVLRRPVRWLRLISDRRVTTSGGPNFA